MIKCAYASFKSKIILEKWPEFDGFAGHKSHKILEKTQTCLFFLDLVLCGNLAHRLYTMYLCLDVRINISETINLSLNPSWECVETELFLFLCVLSFFFCCYLFVCPIISVEYSQHYKLFVDAEHVTLKCREIITTTFPCTQYVS